MKKILSMALALTMLLGLLSGCGEPQKSATSPAGDPNVSQSSTPSQQRTAAPETTRTKPYRLGVLNLGALSTTFKAATIAIEDMCKASEVELVLVEFAGGFGDEGFLTTYENMLDMGVDGVVVSTFSEGVIKLLADLFESRDVDWFLANRQISDPKLKEYVFSKANFVGNCFCDEEGIAYDIVEQMSKDNGVKNLAVIGLTQGDLNGDLRDKGIAAACKDNGINLLTETRGITTVGDISNAVEGIISSYPEVDGIFIVGGAMTTGALAGVNQALANHKLSDKVTIGMIDIATGMSEYMGDGKPLKIVAGGNLVLDYVFAAASMINQSNGINADKTPYVIDTNMMLVYTSEDAADYDKYCENTEVPIISGTKWYDTLLNQNLDAIQKFSDSFSIAQAKALRG